MKFVKLPAMLLSLLATLLICTHYTYALRFVVCSDCRAPKADASKAYPNNLYNTTVLAFINAKIVALSPTPEFVMVLGDMVNYASPNGGPTAGVTNNLTYWKSFMNSYLGNIPVYACVGNSDLYGTTTWWTEEARQTEFAQVFSYFPSNGPTTPVDFRKLVYSFEAGSGNDRSLFVVLDSYGIYGTGSTATHCDNDFDPYPYAAEQTNWFSAQASGSTAPNKFVFTHGPAFSVMGYPVARNVKKIWDIAVENKFDTFFCAHEHIYHRWLVDKNAYPAAPGNLTQVLAGTAGAVIDSPSNIKANPDGRIVFQYHYVVVDVNANNITMTTYGLVPTGSTYTAMPIDVDMITK